ncbi:PEGA domain-containing protein, partial [Hyalangium sp.]|uniref:PEGA domain-containing protein n=1 Tax=Hyalangium sp. TaxID=2028555 RepID=UPI002D45E24F
ESPSPTDPPATSPQAESADEGPPKVAEAPPPANPRPRPRAKPALTKPVGKGTLAFRVRPFATIFINGKNYGQTPIAPVELPAATYTVRLVNEQLQKNVTQTVELKPGENRVVKFNFEG